MKINWTGERLETEILNSTTIEHLHRYALASIFCKDKTVLDIACGEGYGSNILSKIAGQVVGVDISGEVIENANTKYKAPNLFFLTGSADSIPIHDNSVDVVVSFETIEHHDKHKEMIEEFKRVLRAGGILIISSPDKKYYSDIRNYNNPFHVKELYFDEFKKLLQQFFANTDFFFQKFVTGSFIVNESLTGKISQYEGGYEKIEHVDDFSGVYNICIASDLAIPKFELSFFDGSDIIRIYIQDSIDQIKKSRRYRIGNALLKPIDWIKKIIK